MQQDILADDPDQVRLGGSDYLWRDGELLDASGRAVPLRAKSLRMFAVLLARRGKVVGKDRLGELVWPDVIATDESIARCIADIRKALGDDGYRVVETFPKRGYRLNVEPTTARHGPAAARRLPVLIAAVCALAVVSGGLWLNGDWTLDRADALTLPADHLREAVAILPFSAVAEANRFLAAGLSDDLEIHLAEMSGIKIVSQAQSHAESHALADTSRTPVDIARALDARFLVAGSVRESGAEIAVSLQLIDGSDGTTLWAGRYEGPRDGVLAFRHGLPEQLVGAMEIALDDRDRQRLSQRDTVDPAAFEDVLRARRALTEFTYQGNLAAERHLRRAVARDPNYAPAYAELAAAFAIRLENGWVVLSRADAEKAFHFAGKALALDPDLWLAHYTLGRLHSIAASGDTEAALQHLRTAMSLQPANDDARVYYAIVTMMSGRPGDALPLLESVMATHPAPPFWYHLGLANTLFHLRRYVEAKQAASDCLWQMPNSPYCLRTLIATHAQLGEMDDAAWYIAEYEALGHEPTVESMMKSAIERDSALRSHLHNSYRLAVLD